MQRLSVSHKIRFATSLAGFALGLAKLHASDVDQYRDTSYYVTTGKVVGMTLLIDFPDDQAATNYNATVMNNLMTQPGFPGFGGYGWTALGSIRDYFRLASGGRFDYIGNVFNFSTNFNNGGGNCGYYRASLSKTNYNYSHMANFFGVISNALVAAKNQGFDFSTLTTNSYGDVVGLTVLYANTNSYVLGPAGQYIDWSPPTNGAPPFFSANGVTFRWYAVSLVGQSTPTWPEINTTSHECSHMLTGWTDMDGRTQTGNGNGQFCVMSSGGGGMAQFPPLPSAFLRSMIGWIDKVDIASNTPPLDTVLTSARNTCYRYRNPSCTNEYFLVELRDVDDSQNSGYAMAIWHVDEFAPLLSNYYGTSNTPSKHCRCQLVEADHKLDLENKVNTGSMDDLFFSPNTDRFDDFTTPSAHWWNGSNSCFAIGHISSRSPVMRFCINPLVLNAYRIVHGLVGVPFSYPIQLREGITFSLTAAPLPAGLALVGNTITGTPTAGGTTIVMLTANTGSAQYPYPLTIRIASNAAPVIDSPLNVAVSFQGCYLHYDITATGAEPITYGFTTGPSPLHNTLLSGGSFSNGLLSGALTGVGIFTNTLTIMASNIFGCDTQVLNIALTSCSTPAITNGIALPPTGHVGTACTFAFAYPDNPPPVFSVTSGALPTGLSLSYDGIISGTPTAAGSFTGLVSAGNISVSIYTQAFVITVQPLLFSLTVANSGHGSSSLGGESPFASVTIPAGTATQLVYTAADWYRILQLTSNSIPDAAAVGAKVYTQVFNTVVSSISNSVIFSLATTNQTGYLSVPTDWLTNWPESSIISDPAFSVPDKYLMGLNPTTSNTCTLSVASFRISGSNAVTAVRRTYTGGLSPDGMHGYLLLQAAKDLGTTFTNVAGTGITGNTVFDGVNQRTYTNTISGNNQFLRAVIQ